MKKEDLLITKLIEYGKTDMYPMHMPGHKRRATDSVLQDFPNPFLIDITEIEGFDNLHYPEDLLKDSMEWAASVYGADQTYYLVNGSSGGILSAVCAATSPGGSILISRNCHKSVYHGIILNRLKSYYVYPQIIEELGIQGGISKDDVENILCKNPDIGAVLIVSPTYDGVVSDIRGIAEAVHAHGIPLIVDEAHGAHFSFAKVGRFPASALECGADIVIQSLHKTLPALTQTAILHVKKGLLRLEKLERYLQIFQSSSPSYVFMAGIEQCIYEMAKHGDEYMNAFAGRLQRMRMQLSKMQALKLLNRNMVDDNAGRWNVFALDPSKIVVSCKGCLRKESNGTLVRMDGNQLVEMLRDHYHIEMEMCGADYVVAIVTFMDSVEGLERLCCALMEIDAALERQKADERFAGRAVDKLKLPEIRMKIAEAMEKDAERLHLWECEGRISAEFIYLYPPGIPIVAPGELLTKEIVERVTEYKDMGLPVHGMADPDAEYLLTLK